ncbi:uncharacterized protein LOC119105923 [Pollicipes pollicipes]|uniref:uncharacterized protein LOC119105923 n=1 Tax=Pollicipes pollicipes TaxID=41117 RepID=UPI001884C063|nr:uncharacterized protein LOC119105923 [Pollicipes pollicipes]
MDRRLWDMGQQQGGQKPWSMGQQQGDQPRQNVGQQQVDRQLWDMGRQQSDQKLWDMGQQQGDQPRQNVGQQQVDQKLWSMSQQQGDQPRRNVGQQRIDRQLWDMGQQQGDQPRQNVGQQQVDQTLWGMSQQQGDQPRRNVDQLQRDLGQGNLAPFDPQRDSPEGRLDPQLRTQGASAPIRPGPAPAGSDLAQYVNAEPFYPKASRAAPTDGASPDQAAPLAAVAAAGAGTAPTYRERRPLYDRPLAAAADAPAERRPEIGDHEWRPLYDRPAAAAAVAPVERGSAIGDHEWRPLYDRPAAAAVAAPAERGSAIGDHEWRPLYDRPAAAAVAAPVERGSAIGDHEWRLLYDRPAAAAVAAPAERRPMYDRAVAAAAAATERRPEVAESRPLRPTGAVPRRSLPDNREVMEDVAVVAAVRQVGGQPGELGRRGASGGLRADPQQPVPWLQGMPLVQASPEHQDRAETGHLAAYRPDPRHGVQLGQSGRSPQKSRQQSPLVPAVVPPPRPFAQLPQAGARQGQGILPLPLPPQGGPVAQGQGLLPAPVLVQPPGLLWPARNNMNMALAGMNLTGPRPRPPRFPPP